MDLDSKQRNILERLRSVEEDLGRSPSQMDIRNNSDEFSTEYEIRKHFDSFNQAKEIAGLEIDAYSNEIKENIKKDSDLAYFLGVLAGDGCVYEIGNGCKAVTLTAKDDEMIENFAEIGEKKFGVEPKRDIQYTDGDAYERINFYSSEMANWLGDWGFKKWATTIREDFKWVITEHPEEFISGIFDAEGTNSTDVKIYCQDACGRAVISDCLAIIGVKHTMSSKAVRISNKSTSKFVKDCKPRIKRKSIRGA